ncbi:MAG TPA: hypothetical protein VNN80_20345, partial [Polyangiaceae bacterium]|nr:hypothetical protein [Polyangiaceae bacterium]
PVNSTGQANFVDVASCSCGPDALVHFTVPDNGDYNFQAGTAGGNTAASVAVFDGVCSTAFLGCNSPAAAIASLDVPGLAAGQVITIAVSRRNCGNINTSLIITKLP